MGSDGRVYRVIFRSTYTRYSKTLHTHSGLCEKSKVSF